MYIEATVPSVFDIPQCPSCLQTPDKKEPAERLLQESFDPGEAYLQEAAVQSMNQYAQNNHPRQDNFFRRQAAFSHNQRNCPAWIAPAPASRASHLQPLPENKTAPPHLDEAYPADTPPSLPEH